MAEPRTAALFFRKRAVFTDKMAASLTREAEAGHLRLVCASALSADDVPRLPWQLPFVPAAELAGQGAEWVFLLESAADSAGAAFFTRFRDRGFHKRLRRLPAFAVFDRICDHSVCDLFGTGLIFTRFTETNLDIRVSVSVDLDGARAE